MKFNSINYLSKKYYENITGMVQRSSNNTLLFLNRTPHYDTAAIVVEEYLFVTSELLNERLSPLSHEHF